MKKQWRNALLLKLIIVTSVEIIFLNKKKMKKQWGNALLLILIIVMFVEIKFERTSILSFRATSPSNCKNSLRTELIGTVVNCVCVEERNSALDIDIQCNIRNSRVCFLLMIQRNDKFFFIYSSQNIRQKMK